MRFPLLTIKDNINEFDLQLFSELIIKVLKIRKNT